MSESGQFSNNPFAALAHMKAPENTKGDGAVADEPKAAGPAAKKMHAAGAGVHGRTHGQATEDQDESHIFLQAMNTVRPVQPGKKAAHGSGWPLAHTVDLPSLRKVSGQKGGNARAMEAPADAQGKKGSDRSERAGKGKPLAHADKAQRGTAMPVPEDISPEDEAFFRAMREVQPLPGKGRDVAPAVEPTVNAEHVSNALQDFMEGKLEFALSLTGEYLEGYVVGLDEITMNKLRAGQYSPEAHLDLHGLNVMQAYEALVGFFRSAWYKGLRSVLVVPGRGRNSQDGIGVLRDKLQLWLTQDPFKRVVLAFCTARPVDGGPGSIYVLLRKHRKKGKILWERLPVDPDLF